MHACTLSIHVCINNCIIHVEARSEVPGQRLPAGFCSWKPSFHLRPPRNAWAQGRKQKLTSTRPPTRASTLSRSQAKAPSQATKLLAGWSLSSISGQGDHQNAPLSPGRQDFVQLQTPAPKSTPAHFEDHSSRPELAFFIVLILSPPLST